MITKHFVECALLGCMKVFQSEIVTDALCQCGLVSYCSKEHREKDWIVHRHVCSTDPAKRMKGLAEFIANGNGVKLSQAQEEFGIDLSRSLCIEAGKEVYHVALLCPIRGDAIICGVCLNEIEGRYPSNIIFLYKGAEFHYAMCKSCKTGMRFLCPVNFMPRDECYIYSKNIDTNDEWIEDTKYYRCFCKPIPKIGG